MKKYHIVVLIVVLFLAGLYLVSRQDKPLAGNTGGQKVASSTTYVLSGTSQLVLATSSRRTAAQFQTVNCSSDNAVVALNLEGNGAPAVYAGAEFAITSTSTELMSVEEGNPPPTSAVTAITEGSTCVLTVNEWRNR